MTEDERRLLKQYVEQWDRTGRALEEIKREELAHYDYEKNRPAVDALMDLGVRFAQPRTTSGLVEFQRILMEARRRGRA